MSLSKEELQSQIQSKVNKDFSQKTQLEKYLLETLNSFGYRYFSTPNPAKLQDKLFLIDYCEKKLGIALKVSSPIAREAIKKRVKTNALNPAPTVLMQLGIKIIKLNGDTDNSSGEIEVFAIINWNWPLHENDKHKQLRKCAKIEFDDFFYLRNHLPRQLEHICEIF